MAFSAGQIEATVSANAKPFNRSMKRVRSEGDKTSRDVGNDFDRMGRRIAQVSAVAFAAVSASIIRIGSDMLKVASDAEETRQKFDVVFGGISDAANATAEELSRSFGLSSQSSRQLLGDVGDILTGFGFTQETALELSEQVNKLAVDLASFTNFSGGAEGASKALTKALLGEAESVKALGIVIRQDTKEYNNLVESIMKARNVSLVQAKALAALKIATDQSKNAIGDFERTQDSLANQTRILKEDYEQLSIELGKELIPIATKTVGVAGEMIDTFRILRQPVQDLTEDFMKAGRAIKIFTAIQTGGITASIDKLFSDIANFIQQGRSGVQFIKQFGDEFNRFLSTLNKTNNVNIDDELDRIQSGAKGASDSTRELAFTTEQLLSNYNRLKPAMENIPPLDKVFDPSVMQETMIPLSEIINQIENSEPFTDKLFPPGSLGALKEKLLELQESLDFATDPEMVQRLQEKIEELQQKINELQNASSEAADETTEGFKASSVAMNQLSQSIGRVIGQIIKGKKEALSFSNIMSAVAPALINVLAGGTPIGGFLSGIFGGVFHDGGIVPGSGEKMIMAKGGEMVLTKQQQSMMGGNMNPSMLRQAISSGMRDVVRGMSPDELYAFTQKGKRGY